MIQKELSEILRPTKISNLIVTDRIKKILGDGETVRQNLLLYSTTPGTGKSSFCKMLTKHYDSLIINTSLNRGIDTVRDIERFCATGSLNHGHYKNEKKLLIMEEYDSCTVNFYDSLRPVIEQYNQNVVFVANCNYINKIPPAIRSRFVEVNFDPINKEEEIELSKKIQKYLKAVLKKVVDMEFDMDETLTFFVQKYFPSIRNMIKQIQSYRDQGIKTITNDIVNNSSGDKKYNELFEHIINKNQDSVKTYQMIIGDYSGKTTEVLSAIGNEFIKWLIQKDDQKLLMCIPNIIIVVAEEMYRSNFSTDENLPMLSCIFRIKLLVC